MIAVDIPHRLIVALVVIAMQVNVFGIDVRRGHPVATSPIRCAVGEYVESIDRDGEARCARAPAGTAGSGLTVGR